MNTRADFELKEGVCSEEVDVGHPRDGKERTTMSDIISPEAHEQFKNSLQFLEVRGARMHDLQKPAPECVSPWHVAAQDQYSICEPDWFSHIRFINRASVYQNLKGKRELHHISWASLSISNIIYAVLAPK